MNAIEINHLSKSFGTKTVLKDITCSVEKGEIFGLLGPSGAGKTTLIKILSGQLAVSDGTATLFGSDCGSISKELYLQIGMVMDNSGLYERLNCYDNLLLFTKISGIDKKYIHEVIKQVELSAAIKTPVRKLSKGMRQRLVLARAIIHKPKLLFLDEPTSGLDPATAKRIHELLFELRDKETTIFLTTHNMEEASKLCDNIALLNEGILLEYGSPEEICRKYNDENKIIILCKDGKELILPNSNESVLQIAECFSQNNVLSIHSSEPTLETVFIKLTGRRLA
ncbi:MAG: ABC transporter ATP-binding protein [Ruminiclostridium sp.]